MKQKCAPVFVILAGILWGTMGLFVRHFNRLELVALDIGWLRVFFGFLAIGLYLVLFHRERLRVSLKDLWCFAGCGICSLFMMNLTYYTAIEHTSLAVAGVLLYTAPIFVMLMSALLFHEKITTGKMTALVMAFLGCVLVSGIGADSRFSATGLLWGLGAGLSYALYSIFGRFVVQRGYGSWTMTFYAFLFCLLANSLTCRFSVVTEVLSQPSEILWAVGVGLITAFSPYLFYGLGLESMENGRASVLASVEPVVATLTGIIFFRELPTVTAWIGIMLVLAAVTMLSLKRSDTQ